MFRKFVETNGVLGDKRAVMQAFCADYMHHRQSQRGVRTGPNDQHFVGFGSGFSVANVDRYDMRTSFPGS